MSKAISDDSFKMQTDRNETERRNIEVERIDLTNIEKEATSNS